MPTTTERRIAQRRRAQGILVPILEDLLDHMVEIEDEDDIEFMNDLMRSRMQAREKGVFSPSMLSSCMRQAYFVKTGVEKHAPLSPQTNAYFLDGDFRHLKWQFALWKAHRAGRLMLLGVEQRVYGAAGDFVGTIDAAVSIGGRVYIVDFKGMHLRAFQAFLKDGVTLGHGIQITGYGILLGQQKPSANVIEGGLLIGEAKPGPIQGQSPIALHEEFVPIRQFKAKVKKRLATLRTFVDNEEVPPPACVSTRHFSFQECPFSRFCKTEVKAVQREREQAARSKSNPVKVERSRR